MNLCYWIEPVAKNETVPRNKDVSMYSMDAHIYSLALSPRDPRSSSNTPKPMSTLVPRPWYSNTTLH